jgi:hypothetical protein
VEVLQVQVLHHLGQAVQEHQDKVMLVVVQPEVQVRIKVVGVAVLALLVNLVVVLHLEMGMVVLDYQIH